MQILQYKIVSECLSVFFSVITSFDTQRLKPTYLLLQNAIWLHRTFSHDT